MSGEIGERQAMLEIQRLLQDDHAAVRIDDARVGLDADALAGAVIPLEAHGNARIHAATATLLAVFVSYVPAFAQL